MRILLLLLFSLPLALAAQVNRSANELARERIRDYIVQTLFKDLAYNPGTFGELKSHQQPQVEIAWSMIHQFEVVDSQFVADKKVAVRKPYYFSFYLDKKLKVTAAESFYRQ